MHLEGDDIREFAALWLAEFGETLSADEARYHASRLLELYALLAGIGESAPTDHDLGGTPPAAP